MAVLNLDFLDQVYGPDRIPPGTTIEADAIVIGTGAGGSVVARELTEAGLSVVLLEEGEYRTGKDYGHLSAVETVKMLFRKGGFTATFGNSPVLLPNGRCVGGSTVINSGTSLRALPSAIERWRGEFGLKELVESLDSHYERIEEFLHIGPVPETTFGRNNELFRIGTERTGYTGSVLTRNERGCRGAGRCFLGCPNDAKQAMNISYVPQALRKGARIYVRCRARKILTEGGRAVGVVATVRSRGLKPRYSVTFRAPTVVVAAGAIYTPLLLRGVPGRRGRGLGRHLKMHPASRVIGFYDEPVRAWEGVQQGYHLESTLSEGISVETTFLPPPFMGPSLPAFGETLGAVLGKFDQLSMLGCRTIEDTEGRVMPRVMGLPGNWPFIWYWLQRSDVRRLARCLSIGAEIQFASGAKKVYTGVRGFEELNGMDDVRRLREGNISASDIELSAYHSQGTARMAEGPELGVADPRGEVWGVRGLYVGDASAMPATPVVNPQLSIMAFATHVAASILARDGRKLAPQNREVLSQS